MVGDDVFTACSAWMREGQFPQGVNDTLVTLIPKCDRPSNMKELRSISLCNVIYKIFIESLM